MSQKTQKIPELSSCGKTHTSRSIPFIEKKKSLLNKIKTLLHQTGNEKVSSISFNTPGTMSNTMVFLLPLKDLFKGLDAAQVFRVWVVLFFFLHWAQKSLHAKLILCYSFVPYSYFAMIEINGLLLLATVVCGVHSALSSLLVVELLLSSTEESATTATLVSLHELLNSSWLLHSLQTPLFLQLHLTKLAVIRYQRLTQTATQGQAQQSTELFHRICYCFCWATSKACGYFIFFITHHWDKW